MAAARLEFRDVAIVTDEVTGERILEIECAGSAVLVIARA
jgi:hypothetical protein